MNNSTHQGNPSTTTSSGVKKSSAQSSSSSSTTECLKDSVFWIYIGIMVLYGIIMLSVMSSSSTQLNLLLDSQSFGYGKQLIQIWDKKFIIDIKTAAAGCPEGYQEMLNYEWPGTIIGCNCPYQVDKSRQNFIVKGKCNSQLLSYNCHDLQPIQPEYLRIWKNRKKLCIQRDIYSFASSPLDNCQSKIEGFKKCGDGQRAVCIRTTTNCPISRMKNTAIIVSSASVGIPLEIDESLTYYFERESISDYPIADFRLEQQSFCAHPATFNISPDKRGDYILLRNRRKPCDTVDPRAVEVDSIGEEDLFQLNPELNRITRELPAYPRPSNQYTWKLGYYPHPQWSLECRLSAAFQISAAQDRFELGTQKYNRPLLVGFTISSVAIVSFVLLLIEMRRKIIRKREEQRARKLREEERRVKDISQVLLPYSLTWARNTWILIILDRIFQIVHVPIIFISYLQAQEAVIWFDDVNTNQCGDDWFQTSISRQYRDREQALFQYFSTMLGLWWFIFVIDWAVLIFRYVNQIKPAQNREVLIQRDPNGLDDQYNTPDDQMLDESQMPAQQQIVDNNGGDSSVVFDDDDHLDKQQMDQDPAAPDEMVVFDDQSQQPSNTSNNPGGSGVVHRDTQQNNSPLQKSVFDNNNEEVLP